jgi:hypothetical protein
MTLLPPPGTSRQEASRTHPPAAESLPVLSPAIPSWPSRVLRLRTSPATGMTAERVAAIAASPGWCMAAAPKTTWSAALLTVDAARPEGSV